MLDKIGFKTKLKAIKSSRLRVLKYPVYFANFVLNGLWPLGAVFGCPAHDQRDLDFAI